MCSHYWLISVCNVCARGGDREALIRHINVDKNQIHVHYVGGRDDEDEWVFCEPQRVQLPPMLEKALSQLEHAKAQEVQSLPAVCRLSPTVADVLLASTHELLKGSANGGLLGSRLRQGPPRKKRATSVRSRREAKEGKIESRVSPALWSREQCCRYICMQDTCASTPC